MIGGEDDAGRLRVPREYGMRREAGTCGRITTDRFGEYIFRRQLG
jgi:hypothetical protein